MLNLELKQLYITKNFIQSNQAVNDEPKLNITIKTTVKPPKDIKNEKSVLFTLNLSAYTPEKKLYSIDINSHSIIEFQDTPDSFDEAFANECMYLVLQELSKKLDKTLELMGSNPLDIYNIAANSK